MTTSSARKHVGATQFPAPRYRYYLLFLESLSSAQA
jgi:hypothetical protein